MPKSNSKDFKILQNLNKESHTRVNKRRTLLLHVLQRILVMVLLIVSFYSILILLMLLKGGEF